MLWMLLEVTWSILHVNKCSSVIGCVRWNSFRNRTRLLLGLGSAELSSLAACFCFLVLLLHLFIIFYLFLIFPELYNNISIFFICNIFINIDIFILWYYDYIRISIFLILKLIEIEWEKIILKDILGHIKKWSISLFFQKF